MQRPLRSDQTVMVLLCEWAYAPEKTGQMELPCFLSKWGWNEKVPCLRKWDPTRLWVCAGNSILDFSSFKTKRHRCLLLLITQCVIYSVVESLRKALAQITTTYKDPKAGCYLENMNEGRSEILVFPQKSVINSVVTQYHVNTEEQTRPENSPWK